MGKRPPLSHFQRVTIEISDVKDNKTWNEFKAKLNQVLGTRGVKTRVREIVNIRRANIQKRG